MNTKILFCWLGATDLRAVADEAIVGLGPVAQAVAARLYSDIVLLNNWEKIVAENYVDWLQQKTVCFTMKSQP